MGELDSIGEFNLNAVKSGEGILQNFWHWT
jgi:hypothetical protein